MALQLFAANSIQEKRGRMPSESGRRAYFDSWQFVDGVSVERLKPIIVGLFVIGEVKRA